MTVRPAIAAATLSLVVGCSASPSARDCLQDADCGVGNVCHLGTCSTNGPPTATFAAPVAATTHREVTLLPTTTDPEGRPVALRWSLRAVSGGCDPDAEAGDGGAITAIFWCAGTYEATVLPVDDLGLEGAAAVRAFDVAAAEGAPTVRTGAAVAAEHRCDREAGSCEVIGPDLSTSLRLGATGTDPGGAALSFSWSASPPEAAAGDPLLAIAFAPGPNVDAPIATITNGGGALAGVYRFRVRVRNPSGLVAQAFQEVVVSNRPPTLGATAFELAHAFADGLYVAEGLLDPDAADPDGDAVSLLAELAPPPPAGCSEAVAPDGEGHVLVRIACALPAGLIGDAPRTLVVAAVDANGELASRAVPLAVGNRAPTLLLDAAWSDGFVVDHRVEGCTPPGLGSCFVADGIDPFVAVDPDGDPLDAYQFSVLVAADRTASRGFASIAGAAHAFRFETPVASPTQFRSASGVTGFSVRAHVQDPWGTAASATLPLAIRNRAPTLVEAVPAASAPHRYDAAGRRYLATVTGPLFEDPDGDPLLPTLLPARACDAVALDGGRATFTCARSWDYALGGTPPLADFLIAGPARVVASDGWASASATTVITLLDRPATVAAPVSTSESCACVSAIYCWRFAATSVGLPLPVELVDPDGDPALVTVLTSNGVTQPPPAVCLPGWCYPRVNGTGSLGVTGTVKANTGASGEPAEAPFQVTPTCAAAGACCN
jgi:hypothetical protein